MAKKTTLSESLPVRARVIGPAQDSEARYDVDAMLRSVKLDGPRTVADIAKLMETDKSVAVDALVMCAPTKKGGPLVGKRLKTREAFLEAFKQGGKGAKLREGVDYFGTDTAPPGGLVGEDYVPLMGGPFSKQLYMYDALRMFALAFQTLHHDPIARAICHITRDFTLGRGFRVDSDNKVALAYWRAFEEANNLQAYMDTAAVELAAYGELMIWWLPGNQIYNTYRTRPGDPIPRGVIPRIRPIDPSTCWEIITYPEDITRVISYRLVYPTQYQIYTTKDAPSSKFVMQDIPADQVQHHKINCVSNEKRGRSDLFPAFGYLKRLRDSVNYSVVAMQKATAWSMDTTIEGSQSDIDLYIQSQQAVGTFAPAGSEFVHTSKIKREYLSNQAATGGGQNVAFEWCLSMISAAVQIPVNYFGTHLSGGSTRASALVATEPVAKKFENRQQVYERILRDMWNKLMATAGIDAECEVTFPEVIVQDRSAKLKDIKIAEDCGYISKERAANMASKELGITEFEYNDEKEKIDAEGAAGPILPNMISPLTAPSAGGFGGAIGNGKADAPKPSAVTQDEKKGISDKR